MDEKNKVTGISGWLILPAVGLIASLLLYAFNIFQKLSFLGDSEYAKIILQYPGFAKLALFELIFNFFALVFFLQVSWLFFRKKEALPKVMIALMWVVFSFALLDFIWSMVIFDPQDALAIIYLLRSTNVFGLFLYAVIWSLYFIKSGRVKNTFVNKLTAVDISYLSVVFLVILILASLVLSCKKGVIKEMFVEKREAIPVYTYPILKLKLVDDDLERLRLALAGQTPDGYEFIEHENEKFLLKKEVAMALDDYLVSASVENRNSFGMPTVQIKLNKAGAEAFLKLTQDNVDKRLAIVFDEKVLTAPRIREPIPSGEIVISGTFNIGEANEIAESLKFAIKNKKK